MQGKAPFPAQNRIAERRSAHIFRAAPGHLQVDTPENRSLLERVANEPIAQLGADRFGNDWAAEILPNGSQVWTQCRGSEIINGGVNTAPRDFHSLIRRSLRSSEMP
jgi:filamentous hemagglutinin